jgi:hypothetical protein
MTEAEIYNRFNGAWLYQGNEYFVAKESAAEFTELLFRERVRLFGIDGFILEESRTEPCLDVISDYSSQAPSQIDVLQFLRSGMKKVSHFNFVLEVE